MKMVFRQNAQVRVSIPINRYFNSVKKDMVFSTLMINQKCQNGFVALFANRIATF